MFILSKKYASIHDVMIADVIRCFPLFQENKNLHFRFETCIFNAITQKKIVCFRDIICPDEITLNALQDVPVPSYRDKIRMKVLTLPNSVPKKKMPRISKVVLEIMHRGTDEHIDGNSDTGLSSLLNKQNLQEKGEQMANEVSQKLSSAAKGLGGVF